MRHNRYKIMEKDKLHEKALDAGLEMFPEHMVKLKQGREFDANVPPRVCYMEGYKKGYVSSQKDMIEKAKQWILNNACDVPHYPDEKLSEFEKAMED